MNGLRFEVGEMAIFVAPMSSDGVKLVNSIVQIVAIGPFKEGQPVMGALMSSDSDYLVDCVDGIGSSVFDFQLRKIDPPAEPDSIVRRQECEA